jgi:hypothetical protein
MVRWWPNCGRRRYRCVVSCELLWPSIKFSECPMHGLRVLSPGLSLNGVRVKIQFTFLQYSLSQLHLWGPHVKPPSKRLPTGVIGEKCLSAASLFSPPAGNRAAREPDHRAVLPGVSFFGLPFLDKQER